MSAVVFDNVYKSFEDKTVLNALSFEVNEGEMLCIMGPSGCGKTTVINLILNLDSPDSGTILAPDRASVVFQEDRLCEDFSALSNVRMSGNPSKAYCSELLKEMGLHKEQKKPVRTLSGGMKRRVAIARALAAEADFYVFDEPLKGLDPNTKHAVIDSIKKRLKAKTFIMITHDIKEAEAFNAKILDLS